MKPVSVFNSRIYLKNITKWTNQVWAWSPSGGKLYNGCGGGNDGIASWCIDNGRKASANTTRDELVIMLFLNVVIVYKTNYNKIELPFWTRHRVRGRYFTYSVNIFSWSWLAYVQWSVKDVDEKWKPLMNVSKLSHPDEILFYAGSFCWRTKLSYRTFASLLNLWISAATYS